MVQIIISILLFLFLFFFTFVFLYKTKWLEQAVRSSDKSKISSTRICALFANFILCFSFLDVLLINGFFLQELIPEYIWISFVIYCLTLLGINTANKFTPYNKAQAYLIRENKDE